MRGQMPAFPCTNEQYTCGNPQTGDAAPGMTQRAYIATAALAGLMNIRLIQDPEATAKRAVAYADALLAELEK